jgi:hypothetical protein
MRMGGIQGWRQSVNRYFNAGDAEFRRQAVLQAMRMRGHRAITVPPQAWPALVHDSEPCIFFTVVDAQQAS